MYYNALNNLWIGSNHQCIQHTVPSYGIRKIFEAEESTHCQTAGFASEVVISLETSFEMQVMRHWHEVYVVLILSYMCITVTKADFGQAIVNEAVDLSSAQLADDIGDDPRSMENLLHWAICTYESGTG